MVNIKGVHGGFGYGEKNEDGSIIFGFYNFVWIYNCKYSL